MAVITDLPSEPFRISMLIYDRRYRSTTIQVAALIGFLLILSWLVSNTVANLNALGKDFNFGFLWNRSGYDINQRPIPYDSNSTHFRAALVGLTNTLIVAFLGCILATIIGVIVGVLRLSKNWLTARLMTVYVESLRNVPVVLWIIALFAILTNSTPSPNQFRGDSPTASMLLNESVAITNRGVYVPLPHMGWQLLLVLGVLLVSVIAAVMIHRNSVKRLEEKGIEPVSGWVLLAIALAPAILLVILGAGWMYVVTAALRIAVFAVLVAGVWIGIDRLGKAVQMPAVVTGIAKAVGLLVAIFVVWAYLLNPALLAALTAIGLDTGFNSFVPIEFPVLKGFNFGGGFKVENSFIALWIALSLYTGAFIAENVRAGIMAISKGQTEAAYALGLRPGRTMSLVILPQALRVIIPPLISQWLNLTKNTSLGLAVSYMDLRSTLGGITLNQTGRELECMLLMMLIYLVLSLLISAIANFYNRSVMLKER
jgi:general L-amino acid transport system permease protein